MQTWDFTGDYELKVTQCEIFLVRQEKLPKYCPLISKTYVPYWHLSISRQFDLAEGFLTFLHCVSDCVIPFIF